jgi:hypothetical protein
MQYFVQYILSRVARNPECILPWKRNTSGTLPRDTLSNKRVSPKMKAQQRVRCMTAAETKGSYTVRYIQSETRL